MKLKLLFVRLECEILVQLIRAQVEVQNWRFLSTLMALYGAQARMSAWERSLQSKEVGREIIFLIAPGEANRMELIVLLIFVVLETRLWSNIS